MELLVAAVVAYALCGVARVQTNLSARVIDQPAWARHPTAGMLLFMAAFWPLDLLVNSGRSGKVHVALRILLQVALTTAVVWASYRASGLIADHLALRLIVSGVVAWVVGVFVVPVVVFVVLAPLALLFPKP